MATVKEFRVLALRQRESALTKGYLGGKPLFRVGGGGWIWRVEAESRECFLHRIIYSNCSHNLLLSRTVKIFCYTYAYYT